MVVEKLKLGIFTRIKWFWHFFKVEIKKEMKKKMKEKANGS